MTERLAVEAEQKRQTAISEAASSRLRTDQGRFQTTPNSEASGVATQTNRERRAGESAVKAANLMGVSPSLVYDAKRLVQGVRSGGVEPAILEAVKAGKRSVHGPGRAAGKTDNHTPENGWWPCPVCNPRGTGGRDKGFVDKDPYR